MSSVYQGCLLSSVLFNIFIEGIMSEVQYNLTSSISIGGRLVLNLTLEDDIDLLASINKELQDMTN